MPREQPVQDVARSSGSRSPLARLLLASSAPAAGWQVAGNSPHGIHATLHKALSTRTGSRLAGVSMSDDESEKTAAVDTKAVTEEAAQGDTIWPEPKVKAKSKSDEDDMVWPEPKFKAQSGGEDMIWPEPGERTNYNVGVTIPKSEFGFLQFVLYVGIPLAAGLLQFYFTITRQFMEGDGPADMSLDLVLDFFGLKWVVP